jgi:UDP-glucuronate decarboxylase
VRDASEVIDSLGHLCERFSGKEILLTGVGGFLGSQFAHFFLALNDSQRLAAPCRLVATDNFMRGVPEWLGQLQARPDLVIKRQDIVREREFGRPAFIIHAASIASPIYYRKHPIETMDANVIGLRNLLDHVVRCPVESMLFFSSSEVYGDPDPAHIPTDEDYRGYVSFVGPRACYDESKRYGETLCVMFHEVHRVPIKVARPFNNYGPGLKITDRRILPDLFRDVIAGRSPVLLSDGRATRTFCYVSDAIDGYLRILLSNFGGHAFNIGTESPEISMLDLANLVIKVSGKPLSLEFRRSDDQRYVVDNPQRRCPNIAKAKSLLAYQPSISLEEGLRRSYEFYREHYHAAEG